MWKKTKTIKRLLAMVLCLCFCTTLFPTSALAFTDANKPSSMDEAILTAQTWEKADKSWQGMVLTYEPPSADKPTLAKVKVSAYNFTNGQTFSVRLKFKNSDVALTRKTGSGTISPTAATGNSAVTNAITYATFGENLFNSSADRTAFEDNFGTIGEVSITDAGLFGEMAAANTLQYDNSNTEYGQLIADFTTTGNLEGEDAAYYQGYHESMLDATASQGLIDLFTVYFQVKGTVTGETFGLEPDAINSVTFGAAIADIKEHTYGAYMIGFPALPETAVEATVKAVDSASSSAPLAGVKVNIAGESNGGVDIKDQEGAQTTVTTGTDGSVKVNLFPGTYTLTAPDQTVGSTNYTQEEGGTLTVTKSGENTGTVSLREVKTSYPVNIRAVDKAGSPVSLAGATLTFAGTTPSVTGDTASFTVGSAGDKGLTLSGVSGYQNIVAGEVTINMAPTSTTNVARFSVVKGTDIAKIVNDGGTDYIQLTLEPTVTMVTIPVPVPEGTTKEDAENLTLTFTKGNEKITVDTKVTDNGDGTFSVTADAPLPDGTYTMTVGGAGFDPTTQTVTVITTPDGKTVVNIGGTVTEDEDGNTKVSGGVTAVVDKKTDEEGNNVVDLTGKDTDVDLKKDAEVTVGGEGSTTETTGGTTVDGGLLGDTDIADSMRPAVMSDPVYEVETELTKLENGAYDTLKATVYLKNAVAGSGSFGMWYDKDLLELPTSGDVVKLESGLDFLTVSTGDPKLSKDNSDHYVYFYWYKSASQGATEINALSERQPIATITLKVKSAVSQSQLHNTMLQALTFTETDAGQSMLTLAGTDTDVRNSLLSPYWRHKDAAGATNFNGTKIDSAFADGDGFYQFSHTEIPDGMSAEDADEEYVKSYDIRIQFKLPKEVTKTSARFWVRENEDTGIKDAEIIIYDGEGNPVLPDPLMTDSDGRVYAILDPGTYYYTITETSHWDYPTGQAVNPGFTKDCFELKADGSVEMKTLTLDGSTDTWTTDVSVNTITPFMLPKTRHNVYLDDKANTDPSKLTALDIAISSSTTAYNSVPYYFTLQPGAGWKWKDKDMTKVAEALSANLYVVDPDGADDTAMFRTQLGTLAAPTGEDLILWSAEKEQFYINATIGGEACGKDPDPLRAGDLIILVENPEDLVEETQYEITATVGKGGTMTFAQPESPASNSTLNTDAATESSSGSGQYVGLSTLIETLAPKGTTSGTYTFTPDSGYSIDKVIINGAEQFLSAEAKAKDKAYTYKFENITGNQTIYVTFLDPNGKPASDANLTVTVGDHGKVDVTPTGTITPTTSPITGPDSETYTLPTDGADPLTKLELTITPDAGYEIDKVLVNGELKDPAADLGITDPGEGPDGKPGTLVLNDQTLKDLMDKGDANSVVITFKPFGQDSTQAIVTATVIKGFGSISPAGVTIYPMGATPTYAMTPGSADWLINKEAGSKAVMLYEDNVTPPDTTGTDASDQVTGTYSYTMSALTGDMQLKITFSEKTYTVSGLIQTIHTNSGSVPEQIAAATLTFKRVEDGETFTVSSKDMASVGANATLDFEVPVPKGTWDVTFSKQGYLNHTITGLTINGTDDEATNGIAFGKADDGTIKRVALIPGDAAGDGLAVAVNDASTVVAGWLANATKRNRIKGDIDESEFINSGNSGTADMTRVSNNLGKIRKSQTYADFLANGSNTGMPTT